MLYDRLSNDDSPPSSPPPPPTNRLRLGLEQRNSSSENPQASSEQTGTSRPRPDLKKRPIPFASSHMSPEPITTYRHTLEDQQEQKQREKAMELGREDHEGKDVFGNRECSVNNGKQKEQGDGDEGYLTFLDPETWYEAREYLESDDEDKKREKEKGKGKEDAYGGKEPEPIRGRWDPRYLERA